MSAEELEKLAEYLDLQGSETFDDAKAKFDEVYARKETHELSLLKDSNFINKVMGKKLGKAENDLKGFAKELGIEFGTDDFKGGQDYENISKVVFEKIKQKNEDTKKEYESRLGADPAELTKEWESKLEMARKEAKKWKGELEEGGKKWEAEKMEIFSGLRKNKLNQSVDSLFSSVNYAKEAAKDELKIAGFKTKILSDVEFDLDENENFVVLGKDKLPISNPTKAGAVYSPSEYIKEQAIKHGIYELNDKGGSPVTQVKYTNTQPVPDPEPPTRKIHPSALAAAQR